MSAADYWLCPICGKKALYDDVDRPDDAPAIEVVHTACLWQDRADREKALREQIAKDIAVEADAAKRSRLDARTRSPREELAFKVSGHIARGGACLANPQGVPNRTTDPA